MVVLAIIKPLHLQRELYSDILNNSEGRGR